MLRTSDRMIGTESKLVWMFASCERLEATAVASPNSRPSAPILTGFRTVNEEAPRDVSATGPEAVMVCESTSPCTSRLKRISSGVKRTEVVCSTVRVPRTGRPSTTSSILPLETFASGSIFSTSCWCTVIRTLAAA